MESNGTIDNRVVELFSGKTILITGGTGYVGKVLIEKLLRSCSDVKKIYVIIRTKKDQNPNERTVTIFKLPLFDVVRKEQGDDIFAKVEAISGDVCAPDLALSTEDREKLIEETEFIYHCAATVRFDESLKKTVLLNVRGTQLMLELAKQCKRLKFFSYLSTAYCHENQEVLREEFYPPPADPHRILKICKWLNESAVEKISKDLRGASANNYSFSKALAEALVEEEKNNLPVTIHRPSAVLPSVSEPIPGWCDSLNGPVGICIAAGKGVLRTMYAREDILIDSIPVDTTVNILILTTYDYLANRGQQVYNIVGLDKVQHLALSARKMKQVGLIVVTERIPFSKLLWYPNLTLTQSRMYNCFNFFFFQLLPALLVDTILFVVGVKPFLFKVQKRIWRGYQIFEYYTNREWRFESRNRHNLLNSKEKETFPTNIETIDLDEYFFNSILAARRYRMKEPDDDIPNALRRMKILRWLDIFCKVLFSTMVTFFIVKRLY